MDNNYRQREITLEEQKQLQLGIFECVHNYCIKHNLRYFMTGGTLLGAVRHKGYIPWDDDVDIIMPRADYMRFIELCEEEPLADNLSVTSIYNDKRCIFPFLKVYRKDTVVVEKVSTEFKTGVWLDVFPLDNMSDDLDKATRLFNEIKHLRTIKDAELWASNNSIAWWKRILLVSYGKILRTIYPLNHLLKMMEKNARRYESDTMTRYVCVVVMGSYGLPEIMESTAYSNMVMLPFEDQERSAPNGWDYVLSRFFGNYMELPPEDKRVSHHSYVVYWK